jgi:hypothetical protein
MKTANDTKIKESSPSSATACSADRNTPEESVTGWIAVICIIIGVALLASVSWKIIFGGILLWIAKSAIDHLGKLQAKRKSNPPNKLSAK